MDAKEKAKELETKYFYELESLGITNSEIDSMAKNCALICCREVIKALTITGGGLEKKYWNDVLTEIDKL